MKMKRRSDSPEFEAEVALGAAREVKTIGELSGEYGVRTDQMGAW